MARPGIMLYFDILEPIRVLPDTDKGRLLVAMLEYGRDGIVPEFDGMLALCWGFIKPKIDRDGDSYDNLTMQRQYARFCGQLKSMGLPKIPFEEWLGMDVNERKRLLVSVDDRQQPSPTTTAATSTITSTSTTTNTATSAAAVATTSEVDFAAAAAERKLKIMEGELGKGVVALSEYQIDVLLNKLGIDMFDHYVAKLADFIIRNGAAVKSHYNTILKWWMEDSQI